MTCVVLWMAAIAGWPLGSAAQNRDTNLPPTVVILTPTNGARFEAPAEITVMANSIDRDGDVTEVSFFANQQYIGGVTNPPPVLGPLPPWRIVWERVPAGLYSLQARATDNGGARGWSAPVRIEVGGTNRPPPTNTLAVVTIGAEDPLATEQDPRIDALSDTALLVVRRQGPTNDAITVYYRVGGSASNGVDYLALSGQLEIPAGATRGEIVIEAIDDTAVEGTETVVVNLIPPVCAAIYPPPPGCYRVGQPATATAYIRDNDVRPSNAPPAVRITEPTNNARFAAGSDIRIDATSVDPDGYAPMAEFYANGRKIGEQVIHFVEPPPDGTPIEFSFVWSNVVAGAYALTVKATDTEGSMAFSPPVGIKVGTNEPPPRPTNVVISVAASDAYAIEGPWTNRTPADAMAGTNTAAFVVRRAGPTNEAITVNYSIGGTASNGVDYAALSGRVIVAAGERSARILVVPLEDRIPEGIETVVIDLARAADDPPAYSIGQPSRAAAIIVDNDAPRPRCVRLPGGLFHLCMPGTNGNSVRLEGSVDLVDWTDLGTMVVTDGAVHFVDTDAYALPYRFYRAVPGAAGAE